MTKNAWIQTALTALSAFFVLSLLQRIPILFWLALISAGTIAVVTYLLRCNRGALAAPYRLSLGKTVIDAIARLAGEQPPVAGDGAAPVSSAMTPPPPPKGESKAKPAPDLPNGNGTKGKPAADDCVLPRDDVDFELFRENLKEAVCGHDHAIDRMVETLHRRVRLRLRGSPLVNEPPLAIFLLVGPAGIGKQHLIARLSGGLFKPGALVMFNLREFSDEGGAAQLFGSRQSEGGLLLGAVRARPDRAVLLENIDAAGPKLIERLHAALADGSIVEESSGKRVSFQNCVFVLTTSIAHEQLRRMSAGGHQNGALRGKTIETLAGAGGLSVPFLELMHDILPMSVPEATIKARIMARLMIDECRRQNLKLEYVDPIILASQVRTLADEHGFELARGRVRRLLAQPIDRAVRAGQSHIRVEMKEEQYA